MVRILTGNNIFLKNGKCCLNKGNAILSKLRHFIERKTLKSISCNIYVITHLFWHKIQIQLKKICFEKKSLRIIYFRNHNAHRSSLIREFNNLKFPEEIALQKCLFIKKYFNKFFLTIFKYWFTLSSDFLPTILVGPM